jgi:hypothetical protein
MLPKKIPLREIDRSISINCTIDKKAGKPLQLLKWHTGINQGIGRSIFIYLSHKSGYSPEEICDYLSMTAGEYNQKFEALDDLFHKGNDLFHKAGIDTYKDTYNTPLIFYRKLMLAQNYLRYRFG